MNTADILDKAADLIAERGWHQGYYVNDCGGLCVSGAVYVALGVEPHADHAVLHSDWAGHSDEAWEGWCDAICAMNDWIRDAGSISTVAWNDVPGRTKEEVLSALRAAAQAARAES